MNGIDPKISITEKRINVTENISLKFIIEACEENLLNALQKYDKIVTGDARMEKPVPTFGYLALLWRIS